MNIDYIKMVLCDIMIGIHNHDVNACNRRFNYLKINWATKYYFGCWKCRYDCWIILLSHYSSIQIIYYVSYVF